MTNQINWADPLTLVSVISSAIMAIAAFVVISKNHASSRNRSFLILMTGLICWTLTNIFYRGQYFSAEINLLLCRLVFVSSAIAWVGMLYLMKQFLGNIIMEKFPKLSALFSAALILSTTNPWVVNAVSQKNGSIAIERQIMNYVYFAMVFVCVCVIMSSVVLAVKKYRKKAGFSQIRNIAIVSSITTLYLFLTNFILPNLFGAGTAVLGTYGVGFAAVGFSYLILSSGIFNIRKAIFRTVAMNICCIATLLLYNYVVLYFIVLWVHVLDIHELVETSVFAITSGVANIIYLSLWSPISRFYSKLFKADYYDSNKLLEELDLFILNSLTIKAMIEGIADILTQKMKLEYCGFVVFTDDMKQILHYANGGKLRVKDSQVRKLREEITGNKLIEFDTIQIGEMTEIKNFMMKHKIELIRPLKNTVNNKVPFRSGYLFLGNKLSGMNYSKEDLKVINIIAQMVEIGIDNVFQFEYISDYNDELNDEVKKATLQLQRKNTQLQKLDLAKDEFLSIASHQLRTPLTAVRGYSSMILEGDLGGISAQQHAAVSKILESADKMGGIIGDFLNVSRLQTGKFTIEKRPTNLKKTLQLELNTLKSLAHDKGIKIVVEYGESIPTLNLDEDKIAQVMMNFIDNAIFYSGDAKKIEIKLYTKLGRLEFLVIDNGIGIPKKEQGKLFGKFFRASNARIARPDGTGVGLFLARKVIVGHGGTIIFNSKENQGSTFGFSIPLNSYSGKKN